MSRFDALTGFQRFGYRLLRFRRWTVRLVQLAIFLFSGVSAFLLRFDFAIPKTFHQRLLAGLCIWAIVKIIVFQSFRLDRGWWRYVSVPDLLRVAYANVAGSVLAGICIRLFAPRGFPRSIYFVDLMICFLATAGIRLAARMVFEFSGTVSGSGKKRALIYGAGDAGVSLLRAPWKKAGSYLRSGRCGGVPVARNPEKSGAGLRGSWFRGRQFGENRRCDLSR